MRTGTKRICAVAWLALALGLTASAQTEHWRLSLMAGAQDGSGRGGYPSYGAHVWARSSAVASLDATYFFGESFGLHTGLMGSEGKFGTDFLWYPIGNEPVWTEHDFEMSYGVAEIGPEFRLKVGPKGEFYAQLNVGSTFGFSGHVDFSSRQAEHFRDGLTYSGVLGYRLFLGSHAGLAIQGSVRRLQEPGISVADIRAGVAFRF